MLCRLRLRRSWRAGWRGPYRARTTRIFLALSSTPTATTPYSGTLPRSALHFTSLMGQCHEIFDNFFAQLHGPIWTGKNSFTNFFVFAKLFDYKAQHSLCPRCQRLCGHGILALGKAIKRSEIFLRCPFNMYLPTTKKCWYKWGYASRRCKDKKSHSFLIVGKLP